MDFNLSDLQRMLLDSAERYIADRYTLEHRRGLRETANGLDAEAWTTFAELGWLSILVPEELGGLGGSLEDAAVLASALGNRCVTEPFASTAVLAATVLSGCASPSVELLEHLVTGAARFALAHDEAGCSVDADRQAAVVADGASLKLSGQKSMAIDAPGATHLIVTAKGPGGLTLVLLPIASQGVKRSDYALYDGSRASDIRFDDVRIPETGVLAQGTAAEELLALALDRTRVILGAQAVGSMEAELEICSAYLKERQQFGQPIGKFQALQHIMADMFVATHQSRSMLYFALSRMTGPSDERGRAVALARLNIGEAAQLVSRQAIQLHGGYGVTDEYEVSHHYRRQLVIEKQYGDLDHAIRRAAS